MSRHLRRRQLLRDGSTGPKPEQTEMRNKTLRWDCEARNLDTTSFLTSWPFTLVDLYRPLPLSWRPRLYHFLDDLYPFLSPRPLPRLHNRRHYHAEVSHLQWPTSVGLPRSHVLVLFYQGNTVLDVFSRLSGPSDKIHTWQFNPFFKSSIILILRLVYVFEETVVLNFNANRSGVFPQVLRIGSEETILFSLDVWWTSRNWRGWQQKLLSLSFTWLKLENGRTVPKNASSSGSTKKSHPALKFPFPPRLKFPDRPKNPIVSRLRAERQSFKWLLTRNIAIGWSIKFHLKRVSKRRCCLYARDYSKRLTHHPSQQNSIFTVENERSHCKSESLFVLLTTCETQCGPFQ